MIGRARCALISTHRAISGIFACALLCAFVSCAVAAQPALAEPFNFTGGADNLDGSGSFEGTGSGTYFPFESIDEGSILTSKPLPPPCPGNTDGISGSIDFRVAGSSETLVTKIIGNVCAGPLGDQWTYEAGFFIEGGTGQFAGALGSGAMHGVLTYNSEAPPGIFEFSYNGRIFPVAQSTSTSTTLSGEGKNGGSITVEEGTSVTDDATLGGANASKATGTVTYKAYTDPACTQLAPGGEAGTVAVTNGSVPPSNPETFSPGTYYWQASYSGDAINSASTSICGTEIETVTKPQGAPCTEASGAGHLGARGSVGFNEGNHLNTSGSPHQFEARLDNSTTRISLRDLTQATCVKESARAEFSGEGPATYEDKKGYALSFAIEKSGASVYLTLLLTKGQGIVFSMNHQRLNSGSLEKYT